MTPENSDQRFKYDKAKPFHAVTKSTAVDRAEQLFRSHGHPVIADHLKDRYRPNKIIEANADLLTNTQKLLYGGKI